MRGCGPRYCGPGWSNGGAGFRRRASVCPPPHLHKCKAALRWPGRQERPSASLGQGRAEYVKGMDRRRHGGCGVGCSVTRAWEPGPDAGLRAALLRARVVERGCGLQAECARLPPPLIYINARQHCGDQRGGAGKQRCHLGTLGWRTAMDIGACTPKYTFIVMSMPTQRRI